MDFEAVWKQVMDVHLLTDRFTMEEIESTPVGEVLVAPDGTITVTGVDPPRR